jgi:hypothetical protein
MQNRRNIVGIAGISLLFCCIMIVAALWLLGPRIANHDGWIWRDRLPDHVAYSGRMYSPASGECLTPGNGLTQVGSVPAVLGASAPLFAESSNGNSPAAYATTMEIYVQKNVGCYVLYVIEGGP